MRTKQGEQQPQGEVEALGDVLLLASPSSANFSEKMKNVQH